MERAVLYLAGAYHRVDWEDERPSKLGDAFVEFPFREERREKPGLVIAQGLDGEYVLRLVETKRYILKVERKDGGEFFLPRFQNEGNRHFRCEKDRDSVTFQFVNYLGRSRIRFQEAERAWPFEVVPEKVDYEEDYIRLTEALAGSCSALLLDYAGSTSNVFRLSEEDGETLLEQFIFLRRFCYGDNLQGLFEAIKRNPDRVLVQEEEMKPLGTGQLSPKFYRAPFSYSRGWRVSGAGADGTARGLSQIAGDGTARWLPQTVAVTRKFDKLDTPANRFVKYALLRIDALCKRLVETLEADEKNGQVECVQEARAIHRCIESILMDSFFGKVGKLEIMPMNNQVLQKREGYAQLFSAIGMLDLALQLDWRGKDAVYEGESKNVALLYEYWLFFELFHILSSIEGCETTAVDEKQFLSTGDKGLTISLKAGEMSCQSFTNRKYGVKINLYYNRTFDAHTFRATRYEGSYSRPFRPDYTLAVFPLSFAKGRRNGEEEAVLSGAVSYIHFDAKYRISDLTDLLGGREDFLGAEELEEEKLSSVVNTYRRGDLLKMHTYNDAIRRTVGSYVLYPGSADGEAAGNKTFRLFDEILPGVGAFAIKPSIATMGELELKRFIESVLETRGTEDSRLNRLRNYMERIIREPPAGKAP